jgi:hypothetical protein
MLNIGDSGMMTVNVHFKGIPGDGPVEYLGVFDDAGQPMNNEEWREIEPGKWVLRLVCQDDHPYWDETKFSRAMRIWRTQAPGLPFSVKIRNVMQSTRGMEF